VLEAVKRPLESVFEAAQRASLCARRPRSRTRDARAAPAYGDRVWLAVVDADALLRAAAVSTGPAPTILDATQRRARALIGEESKWVDATSLEALRTHGRRFGCVVLLKGADTSRRAGRGAWVVGESVPALATQDQETCHRNRRGLPRKSMATREAAAAAAIAHRLAAANAPFRGGS